MSYRLCYLRAFTGARPRWRNRGRRRRHWIVKTAWARETWRIERGRNTPEGWTGGGKWHSYYKLTRWPLCFTTFTKRFVVFLSGSYRNAWRAIEKAGGQSPEIRRDHSTIADRESQAGVLSFPSHIFVHWKLLFNFHTLYEFRFSDWLIWTTWPGVMT